MARTLILTFLLLPIIEIALFIKVGQTIGLWPTLVLVIGGFVVGAMLLRQQGLAVVSQMQASLSSGRMPAQAIADAMMIGLAALLLVMPGFLTDAIGLALLVPAVRRWIYGFVASRVVVRTSSGASATSEQAPPRVAKPGTIDLDEDDYRPR